MKFASNFLKIIMFATFTTCSCNTIRTMLTSSIPCTVFEMPLGIGPSSNTIITILQAPGLKIFHCDLSQTLISSTDLTMAMTLQTRIGSRFCNSEISQVYVSVYYQLLKTAINTQWQTYISSMSSNVSTSIISSKTSGISALIKLPSNEHTIAIDILNKFYEFIKQLYITDTMINNAYIDAYQSSITNALTPINSNNISTNKYENIKELTLSPKQDATTLYGRDRKDGPETVCGGSSIYGSSLINQERTSQDGVDYVNYIHGLFSTEKSILIFCASKDLTIPNSIRLIALEFINKISPEHIEELNKPIFANTVTKGIEYVYNQPNNTSNSGLGGIIVIGKLSLESVLAAALIAKITKNNVFSSIFNSNNSSFNIVIYGGKVHFRISIPYSSFNISPSQIWSSYTSQLSLRYSTSSNDSDFNNNTPIISELIKNFSPGSINGPANFLTYGIHGIYEDSTNAYVNWLEIFYGGYNILQNLIELNSKTNTEKTAIISNAAKNLITPINCSSSQSFCCRIE